MRIQFLLGILLSLASSYSVWGKQIESLAKFDNDPDGEIVSQRVTVSAEDMGGDTVMKTITVSREVRKRPAKKASGWFGGGDEQAKKPEFPPPPAKDAAEPKRLVRYFCRMWKDENYKAMYGAMDPRYVGGTSFGQFKKLFTEDAEMNNGLTDENIGDAEEESGAAIELNVELRFKNKRVKPRRVKALAIKTPNGFRLQASSIIPMDLGDL